MLVRPTLHSSRELGGRDDGHLQLTGQTLEGARDEGNLLDPILCPPSCLHKLQIVYDDETYRTLGVEATGLGT